MMKPKPGRSEHQQSCPGSQDMAALHYEQKCVPGFIFGGDALYPNLLLPSSI
jgi:hypothetical protein